MPRTTAHSTVPNQIVITIHREMPKKDFIQIKKENFAKAYKDLNATATILYLYLVGNADGYNLDFSPQAVNNAIGMPLSTARDQRRLLIEKGYLVPRAEGSNRYDFYETPHRPVEEKVERRTTPTYIAEDGTEFVF